MRNFDEAIDVLQGIVDSDAIEDRGGEEFWLHGLNGDECRAAIRVLRAAAKIDKQAAILDMNMCADFYEGPDVLWLGWESVRGLIAVLPDDTDAKEK